MKHILKVLKLDVGGSLRVGEVDGKIGTASIAEMDPAARMVLTVRLDQAPPAPLPITLIIAMPRPKVFTPLLESVATLGFKHIHLIATDRVDKTYWASHTLQPPPAPKATSDFRLRPTPGNSLKFHTLRDTPALA